MPEKLNPEKLNITIELEKRIAKEPVARTEKTKREREAEKIERAECIILGEITPELHQFITWPETENIHFDEIDGSSESILGEIQKNYNEAQKHIEVSTSVMPYLQSVEEALRGMEAQNTDDFKKISSLLHKANTGLNRVKNAWNTMHSLQQKEEALIESYIQARYRENGVDIDVDEYDREKEVREVEHEIDLENDRKGFGGIRRRKKIKELKTRLAGLKDMADRAEQMRDEKERIWNQMNIVGKEYEGEINKAILIGDTVFKNINDILEKWYAPHLKMPPSARAVFLKEEKYPVINSDISIEEGLDVITSTASEIASFQNWISSLKRVSLSLSRIPFASRNHYFEDNFKSQILFSRAIEGLFPGATGNMFGWAKLGRISRLGEKLSEENRRAMEDMTARSIIKDITESNQEIGNEELAFLYGFRGREAMPIIILDGFRGDYQKMQPAVYTEEMKKMHDFFASLPDWEMEEIRQMGIPGLEEAITIVRKYPESFNSPRIPNPEFAEAQTWFMDDPDVIKGLFGDCRNIKISEEKENYNSWTKTICFTPEEIKQSDAEIDVRLGETITDADPRFFAIEKIFLHKALQIQKAKNPDFKIFRNSGDERGDTGFYLIEFYSNDGLISQRSLSDGVVKNFLAKNNLPSDYFDNQNQAMIDNPRYGEFKKNVSYVAVHFLGNRETASFGAGALGGLIRYNPEIRETIKKIYEETEPEDPAKKNLEEYIRVNVEHFKELPLTLATIWAIGRYGDTVKNNLDSFKTEDEVEVKNFVDHCAAHHFLELVFVPIKEQGPLVRKAYKNGLPLKLAIQYLSMGGKGEIILKNFEDLDASENQDLQNDIIDLCSRLNLREVLEFMDAWPVISRKLPWAEGLRQLEKIQGRVSNLEHDPWTHALTVLVRQAVDSGLLSYQDPKGIKFIVDFVRECGSVVTPHTFEIYLRLRQGKIRPEDKEEIKEIIGEKVYQNLADNPGQLFQEIMKKRREALSAMLVDDIPKILQGKGFAEEMLASVLGETRWKMNDDKFTLVQAWVKTINERPELAELPSYYEEKTIAVRKKESTELQRMGQEDEVKKVLENREVVVAYKEYREGIQDLENSPEETHNNLRDALIRKLEGNVQKSRTQLERTTKPEARASIEKNINRIEEAIPIVQGFVLPEMRGEKDEQEKKLAAYMEHVAEKTQGFEKEEEVKLLMRSLVWRHALLVMPEGFKDIFGSLKNSPEEPDKEHLKMLQGLLSEYFLEHYFHKAQEGHQAGHTPFSKNLIKRLLSILRLTDNAGENSIFNACKKIEEVTAGTTVEEKREITLVPNQGLLRVFSGDIGDACYTSQHEIMARGELPNLHAIVMVANRNNVNERLVGSALFIEAKTTSGKKALVVRANNPQENLIQSVNEDDLVSEIIKYAKEVAKNGGMDYVVVPRDNASASCSNRQAVAAYYEREFKDCPKIMLVETAETGFNGYSVWNKDGPCSPVIIWSREEDIQ